MSSKNPAQRLRDILENIDAIRDFTSGMDVETFVSSRKTIYAVTRVVKQRLDELGAGGKSRPYTFR